MGDNANGHQLLAVVATVHHERICQALDDGALGFAESLRGISTGGVGDVDRGADLNVVAVWNISIASIALRKVRLTSRRYRESRRLHMTTC
jgi:hypothetical protein